MGRRRLPTNLSLPFSSLSLLMGRSSPPFRCLPLLSLSFSWARTTATSQSASIKTPNFFFASVRKANKNQFFVGVFIYLFRLVCEMTESECLVREGNSRSG